MAIDLTKLRSRPVYETQAPFAEILADLEQLRTLDKESESAAKKWGCLIGVGILILIGGIVAGVATESAPLAITIAVIGVAFAIFAGIKRSGHAKTNFEDRRYELLASLIRLVETDSADTAQVSLRMDVGPAKSKHKFVRKGTVGLWNVDYYEDPWLNMRGRFLDGTTYDISVVEHFQYRHRWKRSRSGKSKHKSKTKSATTSIVRLKPKTGKYVGLSQFARDARQAVQIPAWLTCKSLVVQDDSLLIKTATKESWEVPRANGPNVHNNGVNMIAMMFLSLYQILNLSKAVAKQNPGGSS